MVEPLKFLLLLFKSPFLIDFGQHIFFFLIFFMLKYIKIIYFFTFKKLSSRLAH